MEREGGESESERRDKERGGEEKQGKGGKEMTMNSILFNAPISLSLLSSLSLYICLYVCVYVWRVRVQERREGEKWRTKSDQYKQRQQRQTKHSR